MNNMPTQNVGGPLLDDIAEDKVQRISQTQTPQ